MNKFFIVFLLLVLFSVLACTQQVVCNKPYMLVGTDCCLDLNDNSICDSDEESNSVVEQTNKTVSRPEQAGELLSKLSIQCRNEIDLLYETHNSSMHKLLTTCDGGVDFCFGQVDELSNQLDAEGDKLLELCNSVNDELLDRAQYTDVDLEDLYEELSNELSTKAQEGRVRLEDLYEKLSSTSSKTTVKVTNVIDGDTIVIDTGESVRLIGINSPEVGEECYEEAKEELEDLILGKEVTLESDIQDKDKYGRLLRYIYADVSGEEDMFINFGMIFLGFAYEYEYGSNKEYSFLFKEAELTASSENRGCLWEDYDNSVPICSSNHYNCADFSTQADAQVVMEFCGSDDIHYLDGDDDGIACESLP